MNSGGTGHPVINTQHHPVTLGKYSDSTAPIQHFLQGASSLVFTVFATVIALESIEKTVTGERGNEMNTFVGKILKSALSVCLWERYLWGE